MQEFPEYKGLTVSRVTYGMDANGYGFLQIDFAGGIKLRAFENSQSGEIGIQHNSGAQYFPQQERP